MGKPAVTTLEEARQWFPKLSSSKELEAAWRAAEAYVRARTTWLGETNSPPDPAPDDLKTAVMLQTARLLQRRKSPEGVIGMDSDGLGLVRVPKNDVDVINLMAPYRKVVFG